MLNLMICSECGGHSFGLVWGRLQVGGSLSYEPVCLSCGGQPTGMELWDEMPKESKGDRGNEKENNG